MQCQNIIFSACRQGRDERRICLGTLSRFDGPLTPAPTYTYVRFYYHIWLYPIDHGPLRQKTLISPLPSFPHPPKSRVSNLTSSTSTCSTSRMPPTDFNVMDIIPDDVVLLLLQYYEVPTLLKFRQVRLIMLFSVCLI